MPSSDGGPASDGTQAPEGGTVGRRRPRRASAPPTAATAPGASETPDADWCAWLRADADEKPAAAKAAESASGTDRWYLEQRPPHWG